MIVFERIHPINAALKEANMRPILPHERPDYHGRYVGMLSSCVRASDFEDDTVYIEGFVRTMSTWGGHN